MLPARMSIRLPINDHVYLRDNNRQTDKQAKMVGWKERERNVKNGRKKGKEEKNRNKGTDDQ